MDEVFPKTRTKFDILGSLRIGRIGSWSVLVLATFLAFPLAMPAQQSGKNAASETKVEAASPLALIPGGAQTKGDEPAAPIVSPISEKAIPLAQVADSAEELDRQLADISKQLTTAPDLSNEERATRKQTEEVGQRAGAVDELLTGKLNAAELADEELYWRNLNLQSTAQRKVLSARAAALEGYIRVLDDQQTKWQATWDQIQDPAGIEEVAARVRQELDSIKNIRALAQKQLKLVLTLQNLVSQSGRQITDSLQKLSVAEDQFRGRLFERDSYPLWTKAAFRENGQAMADTLRKSADRDYTTSTEFFKAKVWIVILALVFYALALPLTFKLKRFVENGEMPGIPPGALDVFSRPYSVALVLALVTMIGQASMAPISVGAALYLLWMIVTLRLLPSLIKPNLRPLLYILIACNLLGGVRVWIPFSPLLKRLLLTLGLVVALTIIGWLTRAYRIRQLQNVSRKTAVLVLAIRFGLLLLFIALIANISGYVSLAHFLGAGVLLSAMTATSLYCVVRVLSIVLLTALRSPFGRGLSEVQRWQTETWGRRIFVFSAILLWLRLQVFLFAINDSMATYVSDVLEYSIGIGKIEFTIGNLISVLFILGAGYVLAKAGTLLLKRLLTSRLTLQRGLPYAISKVTYYALMLLVLFAAVTQAGVELNKFTVITGALGVGVGFGLQNIVNNFASGLILLFERPIRVEDTVELNGLVGTVKRIGGRSSTILTFQGAEVIVPNSNLLSNQVINWTLSSPWRRVDIPVGVAYGSDPKEIIKLLVSVAEKNTGVMREPAAMAFFLGFGESALNFELRFWSARQDTWFQLKSDVAIAIAHALQENGIEIPFPQRDLHVRSADPQLKDTLATTEKFVGSIPTGRLKNLP
jgi:potassium-dependent mechanosensitive channel